MPKTLAAASLPPLRLTDNDKNDMRRLSERLESEVVYAFEEYIHNAVDESRWKHLRSEGDLHCFRERKSQLKRDRTSTDHTRPQATLAVEKQQRRVLVTGLLSGSLDDIMYGSTFHDSASYRASVGEFMDDTAVLAKLDDATMDDPYKFLGITWFLRTFGLPNSVIKRRDVLTLVSIHMSKLNNGDRIGVSIVHSIEHPDLVEFTEFSAVRATSSVLRVFRQFDSQRLEVFMMFFLDTKGSTPEAFNLKESVGYLLPNAGYYLDVGFRKKLHWMLRDEQTARAKSTEDGSLEPSCSGDTDKCELCSRKVGKLFSSAGTSCCLCLKSVCTKCSVPQDLPATQRGKVKPSIFCVQCILKAKTLTTLDVAREELRARSRADDSAASSELTASFCSETGEI